MYKVRVFINQRPNIPDPVQSKVETALHGMDFTNVKNLSMGKIITLDIETDSVESAKAMATEICQKLLVNDVSETFHIEVGDATNCRNATNCPCTRTECENYKNCCACVASHRERGYLPACFRPSEEAE